MRATQLEERLSRPAREMIFLLIATTVLLFSVSSGFAGSATWSTSPANGNWNIASNWSPMTVPNGPADTATFGSSSVTDISLSADTEVNGIVFNAGASAYTITIRPHVVSDFNQILTIGGAGIINNSGATQNFVTARLGVTGDVGRILFTDSATAGNTTVLTNNGNSDTRFSATSNAGSATINNNPGNGAQGGVTGFGDNASAGSATINIYSATDAFPASGEVDFRGASTAGNATITAYGSTASFTQGESTILFLDDSGAGNATLIARGGSAESPGGQIFFLGGSGDTARVEVFGNGGMAINAPTTIGSLEGDGNVGLNIEGNNLSVGSNNLSTVFSGVIGDYSDLGFPAGSLTKIGTGTLVLSGANTYAGSTTVDGGVLQVDGSTASPNTFVQAGGTIRGKGSVGGNVINDGIVSPGDSPGTLHLGGNYSQSSGGTLEIEIASLFSFDQLVVAGTASLSGTLDVTLDGYAGHTGDIFTILTSSGLTGNFLNLDLPELSNGLFFTEMVTSNDVVLTVNGTTGVPDHGSTLMLLAGAVAALLVIHCWVVRMSRSQGIRI